VSTTIDDGGPPRHLLPGRDTADQPADRGGATARGPRARGRSIRSRLLLILAVPTTALLVVAGVAIANQVGNYRQAGSAVASARLTLVAQSLVHELQRERGLTNGLLGGQQEYVLAVEQQRARADVARAELEAALAGAPTPLAAPLRDALEQLDDQGDVRDDVDRRSADRSQTLEFYTTAIVALADASTTEPAVISDAELRVGLDALRTLGEVKEATALERGFLNGVFSANSFRGGEYARFAEIRGQRLAGLEAFARQATEPQRAALDRALQSPEAEAARGFEQRAVDGATASELGVPARRWWDTMTVLVDDMRAVQQQVGADVETRAAELRANALIVLLLLVGLGLAALAVAIALAIVAARSITRPLRLVASEAARLPDTVARIQATDGAGALPPASSTDVRELQSRDDEIAEVSRALSQVQQTAVRLAAEQAQLRRVTAESLSSLARRNQNLLRRLLGFITHLERDEKDPAALANLFELDHLATRMRRNAESLLILVGERSPRQWSRPVPISDVVRAALSEVEEYRRVALHRLEETLVVGTASAELAHLIAELLENALSFSPPDRDVEVYGQLTGAGYVLAVLDHGIGMSPQELARANGRLAGEETFVVAPTRYLGHYVVGQLAARLEVDVRLHESPVTGITARITLPASMLVTAAPLEAAPAFGGAPDVREPVLVPTARPFRLGRSTDGDAPVAVLERVPEALPEPSLERTRNGLVKRVRSAPEGAGVPAARPAPGQGPEAPPRSAADVRTSLNGFRAGFERRESERGRPTPDVAGGEQHPDDRP
jgi:signal transduction histidine kinase